MQTNADRLPAFFAGACLTLLFFLVSANAQQRLVIVGGGPRPPEALARFVEWAGKERSHILIIAWATEHPDAAFKSLKDDFAPFPTEAIEAAPAAPFSDAAKVKFLNQLKQATGVFFSGGDQARIMNVLADESLLQALRKRYEDGVVFGGTSAGTAIMSRRMITGEGDFKMIDGAKVDTRAGLALLPDHVIVDQHFIKRQRENRLFGLMLEGRERFGLGIDEGTALLVSDNRQAEVVGTSQVMFIAGARNHSLSIRLLKAGDTIDLTNGSIKNLKPQGTSAQSLDSDIKSRIASFKGSVSLFAKNLDTGETYALGADDRVRTASTIKIAVMVEAFARVSEGKAKWTDELILTKTARYGGSGVLPELSDGLRLTFRDAVNLMMVVSDNTATNLVLDYLSTDAVNNRMAALGFKQIRILRRVGSGGDSREGKDPDNKRFGLGVATPREMVLLMEKLERGEIVNAGVSKEMIELMKREQGHYAIGRQLWELPMASKYGALDRLRSAIGIIYSKKGRVAMAISCDDMPDIEWSVDNPAYLLMSDLSVILVEGLTH
jgi:cyanophycinase